MNTKSRGILAKADLYDNLLNLEINKSVLKDLESHVFDEELELIIHEYLKIIEPKIKNENYINELVEAVSEIKNIPKEFYKFIWNSINQEGTVEYKINKLVEFYPTINDSVNKTILKEFLSELVALLLIKQPIDIELLREYKEKLRKIIEEEVKND